VAMGQMANLPTFLTPGMRVDRTQRHQAYSTRCGWLKAVPPDAVVFISPTIIPAVNFSDLLKSRKVDLASTLGPRVDCTRCSSVTSDTNEVEKEKDLKSGLEVWTNFTLLVTGDFDLIYTLSSRIVTMTMLKHYKRKRNTTIVLQYTNKDGQPVNFSSS
jgi:hypothetical protein